MWGKGGNKNCGRKEACVIKEKKKTKTVNAQEKKSSHSWDCRSGGKVQKPEFAALQENLQEDK